MKANVIKSFGGFDTFEYQEIEKPSPRPDHVLVKVLATGVNLLDHYIREGSIVPELPFPHILGADAAGEVAELGDGVNSFKVGERVMVVPGFPGNKEELDIRPTVTAPSFGLPGLHISGTYTQYMEVPVYAIIRDETGLTVEESATLPVALGTAVHAVKGIGEVKAGHKVLIHSGASGSGAIQIQVAKALGAQVATTVRSDKKAEFAKSVGADLVINTHHDDFVNKVQEWTDGTGVDVVIDNLAGNVLPKSIEAAKATGIIVAFGFAAGPEVTFDIRSIFFSQKNLRGSMASDIEDLTWGLEQVKAGKIKPVLDKAFPLSQAGKVHELVSNSKVVGKHVLLPWAE